MIPTETAADLETQHLGLGVGDRLVFQLLHEVLLERSAGEDALDTYMASLRNGEPGRAIIASIAFSEEAGAVRDRNLRSPSPIPPSERASLTPRTDFAEMDAAAFFAVLYDAVLEREASATELGNYAAEVRFGTPLPHLIVSIVESDEAQAVRDRKSEPSAPVAAAPHEETVQTDGAEEIARSEDTYRIRADDVLSTIGQVYRAAGREPPALDDALRRFEQFRAGAALSAIVADVTPASSAAPSATPDPAPTEPPASEGREHVEQVIRLLYRDILKRPPSPQEVDGWHDMFLTSGRLSEVVVAIADSGEAQSLRRPLARPDAAPGALIQMAHEIILGRGASAFEVEHFRNLMERSDLSFESLSADLLRDAMADRLVVEAADAVSACGQAHLFGSEGMVDAEAWRLRPQVEPQPPAPTNLFRMKRTKSTTVSVIANLRPSENSIETLLENITRQTIFKDHCELIIIDANASGSDCDVIQRYLEQFPNIIYRRLETRIGTAAAWNIGCAMAKGRFLTVADLDVTRRRDSLELQASVLDSLHFVDVTYQDLLYAFEPNVSFEEIEAHGLRARLPIISRYNLMEFDSLQSSPMWRKTLGDEVGAFDERYASQADFDFWLRCLIAGKTFYKLNAPHVARYVSPTSRSDGHSAPGGSEANAISRVLYSRIVSPLLTSGDAGFLDRAGPVPDGAVNSAKRYDILQAALLAHGAAPTGAPA